MKTVTFVETIPRVTERRKSPAWSLERAVLPPITICPENPTSSNLSTADLWEAALLRLDDEQWASYSAPDIVGDGPTLTGDPFVDELERKLWGEDG